MEALCPRVAMARLRGVPIRDNRRPVEGYNVPFTNPWIVRRPALPQGALSEVHDERTSVISLSQHAQFDFGNRTGSRTVPSAVSLRGMALSTEASNTGFVLRDVPVDVEIWSEVGVALLEP